MEAEEKKKPALKKTFLGLATFKADNGYGLCFFKVGYQNLSLHHTLNLTFFQSGYSKFHILKILLQTYFRSFFRKTEERYLVK